MQVTQNVTKQKGASKLKVRFDFRKLEGRIVEKFGTRFKFAEAAGYTKSQMSARLNNKVDFSLSEIYELCTPELLDIPVADIPAYFFIPRSYV